MRAQYLKWGLVAACIVTLWLMMMNFLDQEFKQNDFPKKTRIQLCHCPRNSFRKCRCSFEIRKCSACLRVRGTSVWFDERFETAIEPVQRPEDPISSDALILWLGVQSKREFETQKPIEEPPGQPLGYVESSCRTCAVVGNSRCLRGSGHGFRINQNDMVLRMNQAPVQGFEMDVGNTTTMRIMYPDMASTQNPGTKLLLLPLNSSGLKWFMEVLQEQSFRKPINPGFQIVQFPGGSNTSKDEVLVISLTFLQYIQDHWLRKRHRFPSLGFVGLLYALHTCDQVSLFGFGTDQLMRWSHYWDDKYRFESNMHSFKEEQKLILQLQCEGKIVIYS
ncbi:CMP-N-acetylneuraminate-beta-galactosamide-alpha-2,3-sialyltransferase 2-like isoform X1 [Canis lupus baileyi]|uniref:beta-D-galactosyl-(1->3)-N-acetyl-beta-D-galactosaminide alpha-2,3-sialyltransferase n=3 Tax=Canis lupus familiaris TaxID=9615 RepID=A0A8P0TDR0_CANLF|nr:CMP-N-acetylneuraminate-beta-galactosamide-alpha-2,3-sialyltransferase 2-like isoform X2 [Canis lupus familiaris]XP_025324821.1 CMP-N-acetylneuraminate-beta-galactosamide-alpha-2,3-sialyltransferase 2-like isoform X1 [Canis lupus dingo]|eukprot:XP_013962373.1 CMP-N-acetylneuraminate-beta-galactosamide-alpha-2,3-sialyltransferase 2-like isoform X1 [Canis lupus familiaris]